MNTDDLINWAKRAQRDLRAYAESAADCGCSMPETEALVQELDDIIAGRPLWQRRYAEHAPTQTLLDRL